jgi:hypothetical protein
MITEPVLPLQTILFQSIFLLVAIALEARVFHRRLNVTRKTSVQYATSINLLAAVLGWLTFFIVQSLLPQPLKTQLMSYIFFDRLLEPQPESLSLIIASIGITLFFAAFVVKLKGLELLEALLSSSKQPEPSPPPNQRRRPDLAYRISQATLQSDTNHATTVLLANAYSHSAILLILFLRFIQLNAINTIS